MTTMATHIAARLQQDATVTSLCASRVYDHDVRKAGPEAQVVEGPFGFTTPYIVVDDSGGLRAPFGPTSAYQDRIRVWIFAENSTTGRSAIEQLTARVLARLHRWQEANTKALVSFADRTGFVADPPPHTGAMDVLTFAVAGVYVGLTTS